MENKLIGYLPIIGIFITIGLLLFNAIKNSNNQPTQPLDNVIKNINNTSASNNVDDSKKQETPNMEKNKIAKPNQVIDLKKSYTAVFKTSLGDMKIKLYTQEAPTTVNNFVYLAKNKFYDGLIFHRIIKGFMIQGGDPSGKRNRRPGL